MNAYIATAIGCARSAAEMEYAFAVKATRLAPIVAEANLWNATAVMVMANANVAKEQAAGVPEESAALAVEKESVRNVKATEKWIAISAIMASVPIAKVMQNAIIATVTEMPADIA